MERKSEGNFEQLYCKLYHTVYGILDEYTDGHADDCMDAMVDANCDMAYKIRDVVLHYIAQQELGDVSEEQIQKRVDEIDHEWAWG